MKETIFDKILFHKYIYDSYGKEAPALAISKEEASALKESLRNFFRQPLSEMDYVKCFFGVDLYIFDLKDNNEVNI